MIPVWGGPSDDGTVGSSASQLGEGGSTRPLLGKCGSTWRIAAPGGLQTMLADRERPLAEGGEGVIWQVPARSQVKHHRAAEVVVVVCWRRRWWSTESVRHEQPPWP